MKLFKKILVLGLVLTSFNTTFAVETPEEIVTDKLFTTQPLAVPSLLSIKISTAVSVLSAAAAGFFLCEVSSDPDKRKALFNPTHTEHTTAVYATFTGIACVILSIGSIIYAYKKLNSVSVVLNTLKASQTAPSVYPVQSTNSTN